MSTPDKELFRDNQFDMSRVPEEKISPFAMVGDFQLIHYRDFTREQLIEDYGGRAEQQVTEKDPRLGDVTVTRNLPNGDATKGLFPRIEKGFKDNGWTMRTNADVEREAAEAKQKQEAEQQRLADQQRQAAQDAAANLAAQTFQQSGQASGDAQQGENANKAATSDATAKTDAEQVETAETGATDKPAAKTGAKTKQSEK